MLISISYHFYFIGLLGGRGIHLWHNDIILLLFYWELEIHDEVVELSRPSTRICQVCTSTFKSEVVLVRMNLIDEIVLWPTI